MFKGFVSDKIPCCATFLNNPSPAVTEMDAALVHCNYSSWYSQYSPLTYKSLIVNLTPEFIGFLHEEGITVCSTSKAVSSSSSTCVLVCVLLSSPATPHSALLQHYLSIVGVCAAANPFQAHSTTRDAYSLSTAVAATLSPCMQLPTRSKPTEIVVQGVDYDPEDTYSSSSSATADDAAADTSSDSGSDVAEQQPWHERFPELYAAVEAAIQQLGGQVAPRLNWSSPTDALWISAYNSLKCCNADQVGLLKQPSMLQSDELMPGPATRLIRTCWWQSVQLVHADVHRVTLQ
jgi:hypothetical protein